MVVTKHISLVVTRISTILVILGCVQTYANSSRFSELEKDAVNNSENLEFGTGKENNQGGSPLYTIDYDRYGNILKLTKPENHRGQRMWHKYTYDDKFII